MIQVLRKGSEIEMAWEWKRKNATLDGFGR